jgi:hypothetical protein
LASWGKTANVYLDGNAVKLKPPLKRKRGGGRKPKYSMVRFYFEASRKSQNRKARVFYIIIS